MPRMFKVFKDINDGAGPKKIECFHPQFFEVRLTEKMNKKPKKITCGSVVLLMKTQILYVRVNIFILYTPCDVGKLMQRDNL